MASDDDEKWRTMMMDKDMEMSNGTMVVIDETVK